MQLSRKTRLLNALRSVLKNPPAERVLRRLARGRDPESLMAKVLPRSYLYASHTMRSFQLYGYRWDDLDISDAIQWYLYFGLRDSSHEALLSLCRPGDTVVDVGANIGVTALRMARAVGPAGHVHAFEPDASSFAKCVTLCRSNEVRNVDVHRLAVSDRPGTAFLEVQDPYNLGMNRLATQGEPVTTVTLDEFARERSLARVDLIKIDVEGHECSVLEGARETIEAHGPRLFIEYDDRALQAHGRSGREIFARLRDAGYTIQDAGGRRLSESPSHVHIDLVCTKAP